MPLGMREHDFQSLSIATKPVREREDATDDDASGDELEEADAQEHDEDGIHVEHPASLPHGQLQHPPEPAPRRRAEDTGVDVALATVRLANEVEELRRRRFELASLRLSHTLNTSRNDRLVTTALEYYDSFRVGLLTTRVPTIMQFLSARIDHELFTYGADSSHNTETLIQQWQRYTRMLPSIAIRVQATNCTHFLDPSDPRSFDAASSDPTLTTSLVDAHGMLSGIISPHTIRTLLPHLLPHHDLLRKLLGQELHCPISLRFYFNSVGRVIRLDFHADFFQGFGAVPGIGLLELSVIMEHAVIGENSIVAHVDEDSGDDDDFSRA